jgi:hypothetical protein
MLILRQDLIGVLIETVCNAGLKCSTRKYGTCISGKVTFVFHPFFNLDQLYFLKRKE